MTLYGSRKFWLINFLQIIITIGFSINFQQSIVYAQSSHSVPKFEHYTIADGLSNNTVTAITQDSRGFLWFGTYSGLSRFDGHEFKIYKYDESNPNTICDNMIGSIMEDHYGKLWIGTSLRGLSIMDPVTEEFQHFPGGTHDSLMVADPIMTTIYEDSEGQVWLGSKNGLTVVSKDRNSYRKFAYNPYSNLNQLNGKEVLDIVEDQWNRMWIATNNQKLCMYEKASGRFFEVPYTIYPLNNEQDDYLKNLYLENDSTLWIASNYGGLSKLNLITLRHESYVPPTDLNGPCHWMIRDIVQNGDELWLATDGSGLGIFNLKTQTFTNYKSAKHLPNTISSNQLWTLFKDNQDMIWVGSYQGGVNQYDISKNHFSLKGSNVLRPEISIDYPIKSLSEDDQGQLWIGTDWGGLYHEESEGGLTRYYSRDAGNTISTDVIKSMNKGPNETLLIGTYKYGLMTYNQKRSNPFKHFIKTEKQNQSLPNNHIWSVYTDSEDIIWLGTLSAGIGTFDLENETFQSLEIGYLNHGQRHVYHIYEDSNKDLWFSTDGGVIKFHRKKQEWDCRWLHQFGHQKDHELYKVKSVYEDDRTNIWMATGGGLIKYEPDRNQIRIFNRTHGLPELPILNIVPDDFGNLILITSQYISLFDPARERITSYWVPDNTLTHGTAIKRSNGNISVGGLNGITTFNPKNLNRNEHIPPVFITGVKVLSEELNKASTHYRLDSAVDYTKQLLLSHSENMLEIKFAALNYAEPERSEFKYKLEGFDKNWILTNTNRSANYTNLPPGDFLFRVIASNNHGVWNEEGTALSITIQPAYWQTIWFKALIVTLGLILSYLIIQFRIGYLRNKDDKKRLLETNRTVSNENSLLSHQLNEASNEMNEIAMSYIHQDQRLQSVRQKILEKANQSGATDRKWVDDLLEALDEEIQQDTYWDAFEAHFNKSHDNFIRRLKEISADLSKREMRICAYIRMGLENQEIGAAMNMTPRTLETARYRIRRKLNVKDRSSLSKMLLRL